MIKKIGFITLALLMLVLIVHFTLAESLFLQQLTVADADWTGRHSNGNYYDAGQTIEFNGTTGNYISNVSFWVYDSGNNCLGTVLCWQEIWSDSGGSPDTFIAKSTTLDCHQDDGTELHFTFNESAGLTNGDDYWIITNDTITTSGNMCLIGRAGNVYAGGETLIQFNLGGWVSSGGDRKMKLWEETPPSTAPTVTLVAPADEDTDRSNTFNFSVDQGVDNCSLIINGVVNQTNQNNSNFTVDIESGEHEFNWSVNCSNATTGVGASSEWTYYYDSVNPTITLNANNAFDSSNFSNVEQYTGIMPLNITFSDGLQLYAFQINISKNGVETMYNITNESISGTSYNYYIDVNATNWTQGWYDIEIMVSDSHTAKHISDYIVNSQKSKITFKTENDNNIKIETLESSSIVAEKLIDRYVFDVNFDDGLTKQRTFEIKTDKCKLSYIEDSIYKAHFVSYCDRTGNWIDFEGTNSDYTVEKVDNYHYRIIFDSLEPNIQFRSIGGLNIVTETYKWYKGNYTLNSPKAGLGEATTFYLNLTTDSTQDNFTANLIYNNTYYFASKTSGASLETWNVTFTTPNVAENYDFYWNITYNQTNGDSITFNISESHSVFNWSLINCTDGNISITMSLFNEDAPANQINGSVEVEILYWIANLANNKTLNYDFTGKNTYHICINPPDQSFTMDFYAQYTIPSGFTHRYILYDQIISNTTFNITLYNYNDTTGISDLKITARNNRDYSFFSNVVAKLQRFYVSEGIWRTVQMDKSGDFGILFFNIKEQNTDYRIVYYDTSNNLLKQTDSMKFVCSSGVCELTQLLDPYSAQSTDANLSVKIDIDNITKIITVFWIDHRGNNNDIQVRVTKETLTGTINVCNQYQTGSSGTVNCDASAYTGEVFVTVLSANSPYTPEYAEWILLTRGALSSIISEAESALWTGAIALTTIGFGLWSPVASIIALMVGLIFTLFLGIFTPMTITFIIVAGIMGIAIGLKVKK